MNKHTEKQEPTGGKALAFIIEGKHYEITKQYASGAELKEMAGIPLNIDLFLEKETGYESELISNDSLVDLARKEVEEFFVKDKLHFLINGEKFISYKQYITGLELRALGGIGEESDLFLQIKPPYQDDFIEDDEEVDLARPGKEHFISQPISLTLIVNARPKPWYKRKISFEELVILAFGSYNPDPNSIYTVTYSGGVKPKPEGTMVRGDVVKVKNKMNFDVSATTKS